MTHFSKNTLTKKFYWDLMLVTVQETFYFEYKQRDLGSINYLMMGTIIISWMKNILFIVTYFKEITFSIGAIKNKVIIGKLGHSACQ